VWVNVRSGPTPLSLVLGRQGEFMQPLILKSPRLELVLEDTQMVLARIEAWPAADRAQVSLSWLEQLQSNAPSPWTHGFAIRELPSGDAVGSCGFKGPPDEAGLVEIAYAIEPACQGRGYAKEAAAALVEFAYQFGASVVIAHTLPEAGPSTSILKSCGFEHVGEVVDPEDGPVWRWQHRPGQPDDSSKPTPLRGAT
jgi:RimJ/RimL family protein N-acetyltransferase